MAGPGPPSCRHASLVEAHRASTSSRHARERGARRSRRSLGCGQPSHHPTSSSAASALCCQGHNSAQEPVQLSGARYSFLRFCGHHLSLFKSTGNIDNAFATPLHPAQIAPRSQHSKPTLQAFLAGSPPDDARSPPESRSNSSTSTCLWQGMAQSGSSALVCPLDGISSSPWSCQWMPPPAGRPAFPSISDLCVELAS